MDKMHSDGSLNKIKTEKSVFGFLRRKRRCKVHISPEITEIEKLSLLFSPHTSPVPIYWNTPVKIRNYYLSESTAQLLPPPLPVKIMSKIQARTPDLTVNTGTANDIRAPSKQVADTVFSAIINPSPRGFEHQKAEPFRRVVSLNKSQSMGVIEDKARSLELSPTRNEPVKPEESPTEVNKSADSSSEPLSDDGLDREDLLQAEYNKLFQIGRESGYDDDDVRQWVDYVLEHGLPDFQTGPEMDAESIETEVDWNKARVPEFTQRDPAVKEIERHYLQDIFGKDIISTHQLLVDNQYTSDAFAASSGQNAIYLHGNSDIASHTTLKAYCHDSTSPSSSSAASHSFHFAAPKIEHSTDIDCRGSDDRSATPTMGREWFRADMNDDEFRESPDIGFKSKDTATQKRELKVTGTSVLKDTQHQGAFLPSGLTDNSLYLDKHGSLNTNTIDSNGLIPLLLPLRYNKASPAAHRRTFNASTAARVTDPLSEAADLSGIASEISTSYPDSPTLGYAHLSTPSTISQSIDTLTSSQPLPRSLPSCSPSANDKMKVSQKNVGSGKFKASPRDVGLPSPCDTFSESSFDSRRRESTLSTKWDEEMQYTIEKLQALRRETGTEINWRNDTNPALKWRDHPNHNREWDSANLRCTTCLGFCNVCRAPCCVYFELVYTMRDFQNLPEEKRETAKLLKTIDQWCPQGLDIPTFLQCTECNRRVCPDCCGVCPIFPCHDRICKECKANPWAPCDEVHEEQTRKYLKTLKARDCVQYFQH